MNEIIVGNIGTVRVTDDDAEAGKTFTEYRRQSIAGYGRAAGESVTWFRNGEPFKEYIGKLDRQRKDV